MFDSDVWNPCALCKILRFLGFQMLSNAFSGLARKFLLCGPVTFQSRNSLMHHPNAICSVKQPPATLKLVGSNCKLPIFWLVLLWDFKPKTATIKRIPISTPPRFRQLASFLHGNSGSWPMNGFPWGIKSRTYLHRYHMRCDTKKVVMPASK